MIKGQTSMEMLAIVIVILFMFLSAYIGVIKRGQDVATFRESSELQNIADRMSSLISMAAVSPGIEFNTTLPEDVGGCSPTYEVETELVLVQCEDEVYPSKYLAANVTNGSSGTPFNVTGNITIENVEGTVEVRE